MTIDPIHQFRIQNLVPIFTFHGHQIAFTNSALFMLIIVVLVAALLIGATAPRAVVPGRLQSIAEMSYEFVANMLRSTRRQRGNEVLPVRVHAVHVRPRRQHDRAHSVHLHGDEPVDRYRVTGAARVRHRRRSTGSGKTAFVSSIYSCPRACRSTSCRDRPHRGAVVPVAADLPQRPSVRQHAGRPHHAAGVRRLHHHAGGLRRRSAGSAPRCR